MKLSNLTYSLFAGLALAMGPSPASAAHTSEGAAATADDNTIVINRNWSFYQRPMSRTYTGKSPFNNKDWAEPVPTPDGRIIDSPSTSTNPPAAMPMREGTASASLRVDGVSLTKKAPAQVGVGEEFSYDLVATASADVGDVTVMDVLPDAVDYISSTPSATVNGKRLTWVVAKMNRGESKTFTVRVKASREGELVNCFTVSATPIACLTTVAGKAMLTIDKSGPETANVGQDVSYNIVVKNTGNMVARNVKVTDTVPNGLTHASGQKTLPYDLGDLGPGQSKSINVPLKAGNEQGRFCNVAEATSSNAGKVSDDACTRVVKPGIKITKITTDKDLFFNRPATYTISVKNTGDVPLTGVVVTDNPAAGTTLNSVDGGGTTTGNVGRWNVGDLAVGAEKTFKAVITSPTAGEYCNAATATAAQGVSDTAKDCSTWKGITGILVETVDDPDPIQVGEGVTYKIDVTNQGKTADIQDMVVKAFFPEEVDPVSASNNGQVTGKNIVWAAVPIIRPGGTVTYTVKAKGAKVGDGRVRVEVTTRQRQNPIQEVESTTVY